MLANASDASISTSKGGSTLVFVEILWPAQAASGRMRDANIGHEDH